jgi:APA family basic amino acid/polyamine antiporter
VRIYNMRIFKKLTIESVIADTKKNTGLEKTLTGFDLILLGLGFIVGTGVFALTGIVAAEHSGPAVVMSYGIAGVTCIFVALAYAELAVMMPTSGSIYSYSYVAFGELAAWLICGTLVVELGIGAATVAGSWSGYLCAGLKSMGYEIPHHLSAVPAEGGMINLPAILITFIVGIFLHLGTKDSKTLNNVLVVIKMGAILVFAIAAAPHFDIENIKDFMPHGFDDVMVGSSILFFAFTGFAGLSATAEECKNPTRDLTIGIIGSLILSTVVYIIIAGLLVGIAHYSELGMRDALAYALTKNGSNIGSAIITTGALAGMTTVLLMQLYTLARILYVASRDGLLSKQFGKIHPRYHSPYFTIWLLVIIVSLITGFAKFKTLAQVSSMSSLVEYIAAMVAVVVLRRRLPDFKRTFKCPAIYIIVPIGLIASVYLLLKQFLDKEGSIAEPGMLMLYWFGALTVLYFIRTAFMKKESK